MINLKNLFRLMIIFFIIMMGAAKLAWSDSISQSQTDHPSPPASVAKLIFIHHSCGGNWLADSSGNEQGGDLAEALMNNNYFVSAINYGWEVNNDAIGDRTDIGHWWEWFRGPNSSDITAALYTESGQNIGGFGDWPRLADPGGENQIIMFKSCYPNSDLQGDSAATPPPISSNPLRSEGAEGNPNHTVANAKGIYIDLLNYFQTRQDKLFIVVTAPPRLSDETTSAYAENARAFNNWLVNDWLTGYPYNNVAVFDFYNILTSNGTGSRVDDPATVEEPNDSGAADGNHHRWTGTTIEHIQTVANNYAAYPFYDSHPSRAGNQKATDEFLPLLNIFYNRWQGDAPTLTIPYYLPLILKG